jgi:large subunit ribosomal protein L6
MNNIKKKYIIKVPNRTTILYDNKKNILVIVGPLTKKSINLKLKINILKNKNEIEITPVSIIKMSNNQKKKISALQGTTVALIKQVILETSYIYYTKLKIIGIGYRIVDAEDYINKLLFLKLGYSHPIYFKITGNLKIFCLKRTKLFIFGNSYTEITNTAATIRSYKKPEPYKGKGILYETEQIKLKEGKKV